MSATRDSAPRTHTLTCFSCSWYLFSSSSFLCFALSTAMATSSLCCRLRSRQISSSSTALGPDTWPCCACNTHLTTKNKAKHVAKQQGPILSIQYLIKRKKRRYDKLTSKSVNKLNVLAYKPDVGELSWVEEGSSLKTAHERGQCVQEGSGNQQTWDVLVAMISGLEALG